MDRHNLKGYIPNPKGEKLMYFINKKEFAYTRNTTMKMTFQISRLYLHKKEKLAAILFQAASSIEDCALQHDLK